MNLRIIVLFVNATLLISNGVSAKAQSHLNDAFPALRAGQWDDALPILETIVAANPYAGRARFYLADTYQKLGRHKEAIDAFRAALDLGVSGNRRGIQSAHVGIARSLAKTGDPEGALAHLEEAWANWGFDELVDVLSDDDFALLHDSAQLKELAGLDIEAESGDRIARWRADLRYLRRLLVVAHPAPFHAIDESTWVAAADDLHRKMDTLSDQEIAAEFMRLLTLIGDGHTAIYPPTEGELAWHLLPIFPVRMADGWFVAAAAPEYSDLVGAELVSGGGKPWPEVFEFVASHMARDNEFTPQWLAGVGLQFAEVYSLAASTSLERKNASQVTLVGKQPDGAEISSSIAAEAIRRNPNSHWAPAEWTTAYKEAPLWLRNPEQPNSHEMLTGGRLLYTRILQTSDGTNQSLAQYGRELREFYASQEAESMIIDLRLNNGGDANDARGLVSELIRIPGLTESGKLVVLIGPRTYSATGYLVGMLEKYFQPMLIGWPTGCRPVGYSSERSFRLPYSGLTGSISYELRIDGSSTDDLRSAFFPDFSVWPTGNDLREARDPVLDKAVEVLGR